MTFKNSREEEMKTAMMSQQNWPMLKDRPKD